MIRILETNYADLLATINEELQELHHELYPKIFKPYHKQEIAIFFKDTLEKPNVKAFVATENEKSIGYVLLFVQKIPENAFQYERSLLLLDHIVVLKNNRSKGVGKLLMDKTLDYAKSQNIDVVELNHWTRNERARSFFTQCGFTYHNEKMFLAL